MRRAALFASLAWSLLCGIGVSVQAQSIALTGGTYSQDFDTLSNTAGSTTNTALPTGWLLTETGGGARDNEQYAVDTGASNTGDIYSYGAAGSTERAFGGLRSGTLVPVFGACFNNATGATLTSFEIAYTGEHWRLGTAARTDTLAFEYSLDATSLTTGTWTGVAALNFVTPNTGGTAGARDGNAAANRTAISATISSVSIASGAVFCIRWTDTDASGADDGLAVDDFSITASGAPLPLLSIDDVSVLEGDSGTTTATFTVSLSAPAGVGGVTFGIATANDTATAGSDYAANSLTGQSIPAGSSSYSFSVTINGDTTPEANETFFVNVTNVTGATIGDGQGQGTIQNDDVSVVQIHDIQGPGLTSPLNGAVVTTEGIVTAQKFNNGFFLQTADANVDADPNTSQGIFVFTSTAPAATATVGNRVRVTGTVTEFIPSTDLNQRSITEIVSVTSIQVLSTGNPLPTPVVLSSADFGAASTPATAEKFEGMRVTIASARVVAGSDGNIAESSATASTTGVFHVVLDGVNRPFREPGIGVMDVFPIPGGKNPPRFDTNQERIMVRSRGQVGATAIALDVDATVTNMTGVMDYFGGTWALLPDAGVGTVTGGKTASAVSDSDPADVTIATANLQRFFDEVNDSNGAPTLTAAALDKRLTKASLAICDYLKTPDILGVVEVENLRVLGLLADRINATCASAPAYVPYLVQGNDVGGINVGFLVSNRSVGLVNRVEVLEVTQFGKDTLFTNPDSSTALLNDRPPLLLRAIVHGGAGNTYPVTVIVNHLRGRNGVDDTGPGSSGWPSEGDRVRAKRGQQALFLADLVHQRQLADPSERIVVLGDFNAFEFNDGYVDVMGIVRGNESAEPNAISYFDSPITRPLIDGSSLIADATQRYSHVSEGNAQALDHVLVNEPIVLGAQSLSVEYARVNADFGVHNYGVAGSAVRSAARDPVRLTIRIANTADLSITKTNGSTTSVPGGRTTYTLTASNAGPSNVSDATVADAFPASLTCTWTCVGAGGGTCTAAGAGNINDTANLPVGGSVTYTASCNIGASATGTLSNTATVISTTTDPNPGNNSATDSDTLIAEADLAITKTDGVASVTAGGSTTYTIVASNSGSSNVSGATVVDTFPAVLTCTWTCAGAGGGSCTASGTGNISDTVNLPVGGSVTYTASCNIAASATGTLSNTATVSSGVTDRTPGNNSATDVDVVNVPTYVVSGVANPVAGGSVNCTSPVAQGSTTSCTATANAGYSLTGISGCGGTPSATSPYTTGTITAACTVTADFALNTFVVSGVANPVAGGSVSCTSPVTQGSTTSCTATANAGYSLTSISGCGGTPSAISPHTTGPITATCTVTADFALNTFVVNGVASAGGSISCTSPVALGNTTSCVVTPSPGNFIASISGCGGTPSSTSPYTTGPITAACAVTVAFGALGVASVATMSPAALAALIVLLLIAAAMVNARHGQR
jgi:uncharacterized protein